MIGSQWFSQAAADSSASLTAENSTKNNSKVNKASGRPNIAFYQTLQQPGGPSDDDHQPLNELGDEGHLHTLRTLMSLRTIKKFFFFKFKK